jgi:hypothetical protein
VAMLIYPLVQFLQALHLWRRPGHESQEPASPTHHDHKSAADAHIHHQLNTSYGYFLPPC